MLPLLGAQHCGLAMLLSALLCSAVHAQMCHPVLSRISRGWLTGDSVMDHMPEWKAASNRPALHCDGQRPSTIAALFHGIPKWSRSVTLSLIAFCLITLLGSSATGQSQANGRLAPQDTIELHVSGWNALIGRFMEAMLVNNTFTIDLSGALDLPMIGQLPAAGLREDELAKLITDRLQVMSGLHERAVTSVQRMPQGERTKAAVLQRGPPPAPIELETAERRAATPTQALGGAHDLEAAHARALQETSAVSRGEQAAEVANKQREMVTRERARGVALEQKLLAARGEIDALKGSVQTAIAEREEARRALATVQQELDAMRGTARGASAQARAAADRTAEQGRALEEQRRRAERLARDLTLAQREVEGMKAQAILSDRKNGDAGLVRKAAEGALAKARQALVEERHRAEFLARDLTAARQTIDALQASAKLAATAQANAVEDRRVAEVAAKRTGDALARERERTGSVAGDLDTARQERDAARKEATQATAALREALEQERDKAIGLARDLTAARQTIDALQASAKLAATAQANAVEDRRVAEVAAKRTGDALARERERTGSVAGDLDTARQERDAARKEATQATAALREALEQERDKAIGLARDLTAARANRKPCRRAWRAYRCFAGKRKAGCDSAGQRRRGPAGCRGGCKAHRRRTRTRTRADRVGRRRSRHRSPGTRRGKEGGDPGHGSAARGPGARAR